MSASVAGKKAYHHGGLQTAAIEAGLALLEERTIDTVGLREVARAVGVSATALYRHFPDKDALLQALAAEGLARLGEAQRLAQQAKGDGIEGFNATGRAYVDFAVANPGLFRLIFSSRPNPEVLTSSPTEGPMRLLRVNAERLLGDASTETATIFSMRAWSLVHGIAVLLLDGLIPKDDHLIDRAIDATASLAEFRMKDLRQRC